MENQSTGVDFFTLIPYIEKKVERGKGKINLLELLLRRQLPCSSEYTFLHVQLWSSQAD